MASYDILIKNGAVFDGKGNKPERVDIGISGEKIKKIGDLKAENAKETIDASGKYVAPGFIDITAHSDTHWTLFNNPCQESFLKQGITTILGGNCGSSVAPLIKGGSKGSLARWVDTSQININWRSAEEFFSELEKISLGINFGTFVGLGTLQHETSGIKEMKNLLDASMEEGAFGLSTNLGMIYGPNLDDELKELFALIKKRNGVSKHHLRDEGKDILPAMSHLIGLARETGVKLHFSHFKTLGRGAWEFFDDALEMMRNARAENVDLTIDFFPYQRTGSNLFMLMPQWLRLMNENEIYSILKSKTDKRRDEILDHLRKLTLHHDRIIVASSKGDNRNIGKTLMEISKDMELAPEEVIVNLLLANDLYVTIFSEVIKQEHIEKIAKEDYSAVGSDGVGYDESIFRSAKDLPHPRSFGAFPKIFRLFVREKEILDWQTAIYKMTGLPAKILGIKDRGILEKKSKSDIVIFDPIKISDYSTYENPFQFSRGVEYVIINGALAIKDGALTGQSRGQIIRRK